MKKLRKIVKKVKGKPKDFKSTMYISFKHLSPTQFEEFCFDLLKEAGFLNVVWRKGSVTEFSPADGGRDLEATVYLSDPDGDKFSQKWFVECKHFENKTLTRSSLLGSLSNALSEQPEVFLIITSGAISNPAKDALGKFSLKHGIRIKIWERKNLELLCLQNYKTAVKHKVLQYSSIVFKFHPLHIWFISSSIAQDSINVLIEILDSLPEKEVESMLFLVIPAILQTKIILNGQENALIKDLFDKNPSYKNFRIKLNELTGSISGRFLARSIIIDVANYLLLKTDDSSYDDNREGFIQVYNQRRSGETIPDIVNSQFPQTIEENESKIKLWREESEKLYSAFCQKVIAPYIVKCADQKYVRDSEISTQLAKLLENH